MQNLASQSGAEISAAGSMDVSSLDFSKLYEMQPVLDSLPQEALDSARNQAEAVQEAA